MASSMTTSSEREHTIADLEPGEALEHAVEDQHRERLHGGNGIGMKSTERKFSAPPWKSGTRRQPVLEIVGVQQLAAAADVEHHGQAGLLRDLPDPEQPDVAGRVALGAAGSDSRALQPISTTSFAISRARGKSASGT